MKMIDDNNFVAPVFSARRSGIGGLRMSVTESKSSNGFDTD